MMQNHRSTREADRGPLSEWARYAYGYSDKKPGWTSWAPLAIMVIYVVWKMVTIRTTGG